jgi:pimeloyl-ACP methyl ester carboxylesterase
LPRGGGGVAVVAPDLRGHGHSDHASSADEADLQVATLPPREWPTRTTRHDTRDVTRDAAADDDDDDDDDNDDNGPIRGGSGVAASSP